MAEKYPKANIDFKVIESYRNMKLVLDNHPQVLEKAAKMSGENVNPQTHQNYDGTDILLYLETGIVINRQNDYHCGW